MNILTAESISKEYTNHKALDNVSLEIPKESIYGLLGPNGAGKTTFIRIINQILNPDEGNVFFDGEKLRPEHVEKIGYLPEERGLYKKMKVGEQAIYLARLKGLSRSEASKKLRQWFDKFDLLNWWNRKVEELSKGMQQKIQFIVTVLHEPELLIFDEPFSGFDPINVNLLKDEILNLREQGSTIIFSTHNMASVEELCNRIALIDNSRKVLEGNVAELKQNFKRNAYELLIDGDIDKLNDHLNDAFELQQLVKENGSHKIRVRLPENSSPNQLIALLIDHFEIRGFTELLPSMNDIFIQQVNQNKKRS
ncbi:MAG: ATP-binding cassette domain-containing protein [Bacteroidales bacterium]|nr:ATP-binding cassette domain-containing protein [Bacteroidales bacterium]MCF8375064.1 ATP-binding cassette domain-containing protein [Bacteroidales bacterium]MCF8399970.1 ATP-binding cassette domain-containing protein [Bacteroidales bacterium]